MKNCSGYDPHTPLIRFRLYPIDDIPALIPQPAAQARPQARAAAPHPVLGMGADMLQQAVDKDILRKLRNGRIAPPAIPCMASYLNGVLQDALDMNEKPAARACQAIDLPAPQTRTRTVPSSPPPPPKVRGRNPPAPRTNPATAARKPEGDISTLG